MEDKKPKHGFSGACAPETDQPFNCNTFSLGIFELVPGKGKFPENSFKHGKVKVRVIGRVKDRDTVYARAREILDQLDAGTYSGPKNVRVK